MTAESTRIVPIRGREIVAALEDWLEQARRGEIRAIAFAAVMREEVMHEGWVGEVDTCTVSLYGAINVLRDAFFHERIEHYSDGDVGPRY